ncbi:MAG: YiiX/YebB-like N1pC/P60 family cysteine hydrolase [Hyphomicrobium sp.]|nr:YiiX/YebB-like N1pC/P60 family cysteine hydrolase [Hyphomicrobium sp.]
MLHTTPRRRLEDDLAAVEEIVARPATTAKELATNLSALYEATFNVSLDRYDMQSLLRSAPEIARSIFALRLRLRDQISDWHARGFLTLAGQRAVRNALRIARYATDMLGELNIRYAQLGPEEKTLRGFSGRDINTFVNPAFDTGSDLDFRSGDLLLMRGMHHNSAAIARIGDVDSQFSHLAIVHTDENGKHWVVEALIEEGSVINPLAATLEHGLGRCVLFRHRDKQLAARAAALIHDVVSRSHEKPGSHIWYDFTMELGGDKELFCSKLVRKAYGLASNQQFLLPTFTTRFDMKNRDFVDRIGVTARETFAPADIELEPTFDLVAEWQDYRVTSRLRLQDLLMDRLFLWMEQYHYHFREDLPIKLIGFFGRLSGQLSTRAKNLIADVVPKVPPNMRRSTIQAVAMLHKTAEPLLAELQALERRSIDRTGRPLHAREVNDFLEGKRQAANGEIGYLVGKA